MTPTPYAGEDLTRYPVHVDIEPRFRDTDAMGHVNNAVYVSYIEIGRQEYWKRFEPNGDYTNVPFVMAHIDLSFRTPVHVGEIIRVYLRTSWISRSSFGMEYRLVEPSEDRLIAEARTVQVIYDYDSASSAPISESLRENLERVEGGPISKKPAS